MLTDRPAFKALEAHYQEIRGRHLRDLFKEDAGRGERFCAEAAGLYLDYSKNRITGETVRLLVALAEDCGLRGRIDAMFRGDQINVTEKRSVLHTALRAPRGKSLAAAEVPEAGKPVHQVLGKMAKFANQVRAGEWLGYTGKPITNIVNIGIGGSDLGPVMAYEALRHYSERKLTFRFVSNVDGTDFTEATRGSVAGADFVHRGVEDVYHIRDFGQCGIGARVGVEETARPGGGGAALRGGLDGDEGSGGVRYRYEEHVRVLGLGGRAVLDGFGDRALHDDRDRSEEFRRDAGRIPRDGRAFPDGVRSSRICRC